jgi:hypothetical protein
MTLKGKDVTCRTDVDSLFSAGFLNYSNRSIGNEDEENDKRFDECPHEHALFGLLEQRQNKRYNGRTKEDED